ncbi:hypothetical protein BO70DRAFT_7844 [Aspergillus heteromorphus CBS 117.55]|uniref:Transcription factor domain-containing protein n=1 Tax=Aspergillus heteromorphus CBS 117.55 TaxID=1448321 RepID=A0A317X118_9EURO|nr:uncharacterized protein BO70DRAFT_7844 [Aspergillus heteromorphus CBS 117.55]PWY92359.1 hypothetical protein BO70DRAFT_7844 [Aspergillus heteromorphus CBS 117.55]
MIDRAVAHVITTKPPLSDPSHGALLGLCALTCQFTGYVISLLSNLEISARVALEYSTKLESPTVHHVAWVIWVIYLRQVRSPHATWLASCTLMHMVGTVSLHVEPSSQARFPACDAHYGPEQRRRIYAVAQQLHMWIAYEYGHPRVELHGATCTLPKDFWSAEQLAIWQISDALDPKNHLDATALERLLLQTVGLSLESTVLQLMRCNIGLSIYRRLHAIGRIVSHSVFDKVLRLIDESFDLATTLVDERTPWWHVMTVPF